MAVYKRRYEVGNTVTTGFGVRAKVRAVTTMGLYKLEGCGDTLFHELELKLVAR